MGVQWGLVTDLMETDQAVSACLPFRLLQRVPCTVNSYYNQLNFYVLFVAQAATFWTWDSLLITM